jgi:collagen type IV alpha-3-binding protein
MRFNFVIFQCDKPNGPEAITLRRHDSSVSLHSTTLSTTSVNSLKRASRSLKEKCNEIETFRDILYGQIDTLQQ